MNSALVAVCHCFTIILETLVDRYSGYLFVGKFSACRAKNAFCRLFEDSARAPVSNLDTMEQAEKTAIFRDTRSMMFMPGLRL